MLYPVELRGHVVYINRSTRDCQPLIQIYFICNKARHNKYFSIKIIQLIGYSLHIVLTGDSWINGAYNMPDLVEPTHPGLEWFLQHETQHRVTNLAIRGSGNQEALLVLEQFLQITDKPVDLILFSQCSFMRDYFKFRNSVEQNRLIWEHQHKHSLDWSARNYEDIIAPNFENIYTRLKIVAKGIPVFIIGGNTKFHACAESHFPNMQKSISSLLIPNLSESYFDRNDELIHFNFYAKKYKSLSLKEITVEIENHLGMIDVWENNLHYFLHKHGTLLAHQNLFLHLKSVLAL